MNKILLTTLVILSLTTIVYSQGATCETATNFCTSTSINFGSNTNGVWANSDIYGNSFPMSRPNTCLYTLENNNWFYMKILTPGVLSLLASSETDIDIIAFGPFSGTLDFGGINAGGSNAGAGSFEQVKTHCGVLERQHIVDCGSGDNNHEPIHFPYAHAGNFYFFNILSSAGGAAIDLEKTGGDATSFCDDFVCHYSCATCFGALNNQCTDCPDSALFDTHHRLGHAGYDGTCPCDDGYADNGNQNCDIDVCTLRMMSAFFERNVLTLGFALHHQYHCADLTSIFPAAGLTLFGDMTCDDECDCTNYPHVVTCDISSRNYGPCSSDLSFVVASACAHDDGPCTATFGQKVHPWDFPPRITGMSIHGDVVAGGAILALGGYWFPQCGTADTWVNVGFANAAITNCVNMINSGDDMIVITVPAMSADDVAGYPVYVMLGEDNCPHFGDYPDRNGDLGTGVSSHVAQESDFIYGTEVTWATPNNTLPTERTDLHLISYAWDNPITSCGEHTFTFAFANADTVDVNSIVVFAYNADPINNVLMGCADAYCDCTNFPFVMTCTRPNGQFASGRYDFTCASNEVCGVSTFLVPHDVVPEIWAEEENEDNTAGDSNTGSNYPGLSLWVNCWGDSTWAYTRSVTMGQDNTEMLTASDADNCEFTIDIPALPNSYMEGNPIWIECHSQSVSHFGDYPHSSDGVSSHSTRVGQFRYGSQMDHTTDAGWSSPASTSHGDAPDQPNAWGSASMMIFNIIAFALVMMTL